MLALAFALSGGVDIHAGRGHRADEHGVQVLRPWLMLAIVGVWGVVCSRCARNCSEASARQRRSWAGQALWAASLVVLSAGADLSDFGHKGTSGLERAVQSVHGPRRRWDGVHAHSGLRR
jgi:hypothetical protein